MEKQLRFVHVMARSNMGTLIRLTVSADTDDIRTLIFDALTKIAQYSSSSEEKFLIEHIDSIPYLSSMDK